MVTINFFVPDDGRAGGQAPEDSDRGVRRRRKLDLLEGHDGRLHQILRLGNSTSHHQVSVNFILRMLWCSVQPRSFCHF